MQIAKDHIFHIYNRGNNSQPIFFTHSNYLFFLKKVKTYIVPYADVIAWCLMPNHFHFMLYINTEELEIEENKNYTYTKTRSINNSFAILLRSYTRSVHNQNKITGSLFQQGTKAVCLTDQTGYAPAWFQSEYGTIINIPDPEKEHPQICFNYIHQNPVKAGLVKLAKNWVYSSYRDIAGLRDGKLVNRERINEFGLHL
jgi:putative transposase